jgi:hypothetical protein
MLSYTAKVRKTSQQLPYKNGILYEIPSFLYETPVINI